ncbi:MAG: hypothetical protein RQ866_09360 [Bacteroidales bacterium]|nr:hypothetical protein [Bacteroidales bacterium]
MVQKEKLSNSSKSPNDRFICENQEQWSFETMICNRCGVVVFQDTHSQNWDDIIHG